MQGAIVTLTGGLISDIRERSHKVASFFSLPPSLGIGEMGGGRDRNSGLLILDVAPSSLGRFFFFFYLWWWCVCRVFYFLPLAVNKQTPPSAPYSLRAREGDSCVLFVLV